MHSNYWVDNYIKNIHKLWANLSVKKSDEDINTTIDLLVDCIDADIQEEQIDYERMVIILRNFVKKIKKER